MNITHVDIKLADHPSRPHPDGTGPRRSDLLAYATICIDDSFVVRNLRVVRGPRGVFCSMPSRALTDHCPECGFKTELPDRYCASCGMRLGDDRVGVDEDGRRILRADVCFPCNPVARAEIHQAVIAAMELEMARMAEEGEGEMAEPALASQE
jgi:stage V sporulation protein G